ncbi:purine catabolism regulatory protein, partial [Enterococcus sp. DIV0574]|uniref:PucR family transcriptional regulator ligand-binding domain-containing protein n=1 Tax=Enterococcus sp. DIV0574 TaxID=2774737 RepID=UPI003F251AD6
MKVKLFEVLELDSFHEVDVVAGSKGLSKAVENIYVMEVPDIASYIDRDGLLFTTLFPIIDNKEAMKNFIPELSKNGLAGVAIKLGRYIDSIPRYMIDQAEELSFPILLLPTTANFSLLTNEILTKLLGMKTKELEFRETISNKLQNLLLSGADIKDLVSYVSRLTHMDILVVSDQLKIVESSFKNNPESFEIFEKRFLKSISANSETYSKDVDCLAIDGKKYTEENLVVRSIDAGNKTMGYLVV